ncbi:MAG: hypothetical protein H6720_23330 [Sandaracinus sp.]|nr:hypothetical protein [Sandaracinus sp.]
MTATCDSVDSSMSGHAGHVIMVSAADVSAGTERTYDIQGTSRHTHMVTVTAADFAALGRGETVMVTSTSGAGHTHVVTLMCA